MVYFEGAILSQKQSNSRRKLQPLHSFLNLLHFLPLLNLTDPILPTPLTPQTLHLHPIFQFFHLPHPFLLQPYHLLKRPMIPLLFLLQTLHLLALILLVIGPYFDDEVPQEFIVDGGVRFEIGFGGVQAVQDEAVFFLFGLALFEALLYADRTLLGRTVSQLAHTSTQLQQGRKCYASYASVRSDIFERTSWGNSKVELRLEVDSTEGSYILETIIIFWLFFSTIPFALPSSLYLCFRLYPSISICSPLLSLISPFFAILSIIYIRMSNPNLDQLRTIKCPYNPAHVMPYERFLSHLQKCQFPNKKAYRSCKYNPYHVFHLDLLNSHQNKCPDRKKYEQQDDDWGVDDEPNISNLPKEEKSEVSHSTSFSSSFNSYKSQPKSKGKQPAKKTINNSQYIAQDLDEFNPQD